MKFGRISAFFKKSDNPTQQQSIPATQQQVSPSIGQTQSEIPAVDNNRGIDNPSSTTSLSKTPIPKGKSIFKPLTDKQKEVMVFSGLEDIVAIRKLKDVEWHEEYTDRLPKKPNFYRYVAYDKTNRPTHYLMLRADKPSPKGMFRVVFDKIGHAGMAKARYFETVEILKKFVSDTYGIDTSQIELTEPTRENLFKSYVDSVRRGGMTVKDLFTIDIGTEEEDEQFIADVVKEALKDMPADKAVSLIGQLEEGHLPFKIDLSEEKNKYNKFMMKYPTHKDKYKEMFDEEVPFLTKDPKLIDSIGRFQESAKNNTKFYANMMSDIDFEKAEIVNETSGDVIVDDVLIPGDKPLVIAANDFVVVPNDLVKDSRKLKSLVNDKTLSMRVVRGLYLGDFVDYLKKMNASNYTIMQIASEIAQAGVKISVDIKNATGGPVDIDDIDNEFTLSPGGVMTVSSKTIRESKKIQEYIEDGTITVDKKAIKEKWVGFIDSDQMKKLTNYLQGVTDTYSKYKDKPFRPFEHKLRMYHDPSTGWRPNVTPGTFRAELDMGDVYVPAPKEYMNQRDINEHFSDTEAIAFGYVHELFVGDKKIWVLDEFQSDLVQQIGKLDSSKEPVTWYNPEGKSKRERFKSTVERYYEDWYKVFFNKLIKKAKRFGVDEIWLIRGEDIFDYWHSRGGFSDVDADYKKEKKMRLFRKVYDNTAIEYSQNVDKPEMQDAIKKYNDMVRAIGQYYDWESQIAQIESYQEKMRNPRLTAEQKTEAKADFEKLGLQNVNLEEIKKKVDEIEISDLKRELDSTMAEVSVMKNKTKDFPTAIYNGKYHVIDVNKVSDEKLARRECVLTKYATLTIAKERVNINEWGERAYNWITQSWLPVYKETAIRQGEKLLPENRIPAVGLEWFWEREVPEELKTDSDFLIGLRDYMRKKFNLPELDYSNHIKLYIESIGIAKIKYAIDNPDPSYEDPQTSPMETSMQNRLVDPDSVLNRRRKGRGAPYGDPSKEGDLRTNLPASSNIELKTASDVIERFMIYKEKELATEPEIRQELRDKGITEQEINDTYRNRDKNLYKEVI